MSGVVVVGAGPAGLAAAIALHAFGIRALVVDQRGAGDVVAGSRALFVHHESLAMLESISPGLGKAIAGAGIQWSRRESRYRGKLVYGRDDGDHLRGDGLPGYASLRQCDTVALLLDACRHRGIEMQWNSSVSGVEVRPDHVRVVLPAGDLQAEYVIAADGARSTVRESLGIPLEGPRLDGYHVVVDVLGPETGSRVLDYACRHTGGRTALFIPFAGGYQIDVQCRDESDAMSLAAARDWIPVQDGEIAWVSRYRFARAVAAEFADPTHRILLVGEAAHVFPPFGARGMNSAFADAYAAAAAIRIAREVGASACIGGYARARRSAALINADAAARAYRHLHPGPVARLAQRGAARAAGVAPRAGRWLENAAYGPRVRTGGRY